MKRRTLLRWLCTLLVLCMTLACLGGCAMTTRYRLSYIFADRYLSGAGDYYAEDIERIEINWGAGDITLIRGEEERMAFSENASSLSEAQQLHTLVLDNVLYVQYCESDYYGSIPAEQKHLTLYIPDGVDLVLNCVSGTVSMDGVDFNNARIDTATAQLCFGTVTFDSMLIYNGSGDLTAQVLEGEQLYCSATSGAVNVKEMRVEHPWIELLSGSVKIDAMTVSDYEFYTTSGSMDVTLAEDATGAMNTESGSIVLTLPEESNVSIRFDGTQELFSTERECIMTQINKYSYGNGAFGLIAVTSTGGTLTVK